MRYKSLLYLRAGAIFTRSFARGSGLQRGERAGSSVVEGRGRERGFVRLASGRKRKFENSPLPPPPPFLVSWRKRHFLVH